MKREDYAKYVAENILKAMETPEKWNEWKKEWSCPIETPYNMVKNNRYRGSNEFVIRLIMAIRGIKDPRFATMKQCIDKKWHVKAGSKPVYIEYWKVYDKIQKKYIDFSEHDDLLRDGAPESRFVWCTKYYHVFSAVDIEGCPAYVSPVKENTAIKDSEYLTKMSRTMKVKVKNDGGDRAFYRITEDAIHLPERTMFHTQGGYDHTLCHELAHSTGHKSRMDRDLKHFFGTEEYAYEELIAEISSCMLDINLAPSDDDEDRFNNNLSYIASWRSAIKDKPDVITKAIKQAEKVAAYMDDAAHGVIKEKKKKTIKKASDSKS